MSGIIRNQSSTVAYPEARVLSIIKIMQSFSKPSIFPITPWFKTYACIQQSHASAEDVRVSCCPRGCAGAGSSVGSSPKKNY